MGPQNNIPQTPSIERNSISRTTEATLELPSSVAPSHVQNPMLFANNNQVTEPSQSNQQFGLPPQQLQQQQQPQEQQQQHQPPLNQVRPPSVKQEFHERSISQLSNYSGSQNQNQNINNGMPNYQPLGVSNAMPQPLMPGQMIPSAQGDQ